VNSCWPVEFTVLKSRKLPRQEEFWALTNAVVNSPDSVKRSDFRSLDVHILSQHKGEASRNYSSALESIHLFVFQCMWRLGTVMQ
jgi:hypothetical protein